MSRRYSLARARAELPSIVDAVGAGADVEITRRGELVAVVTSPDRLGRSATTFARAYAAFLEAYPSRRAGIEASFARSLRDRARGRRVRL